jgi:hypothetical protein
MTRSPAKDAGRRNEEDEGTQYRSVEIALLLRHQSAF